jgi:hypothetical protein
MAELKPENIDVLTINNGQEYKDGDGLQPNALNALIKATSYIQEEITRISLTNYPVGSIYLTTGYLSDNNVSPASWLGGTWEKLRGGYALWTADHSAGSTINAGLPNITGQVKFVSVYEDAQQASGAFTATYTSEGRVQGTLDKIATIDFNANNGATTKGIYGNSTTVQPPAYKVYAWKRIA